ncbi:hypothetical protein FB451DRAFT_1408762 [Mycena latifolia]|nr:hypothetical protein FB451DRAFT_1408762 [Mycena latifolia]
MFVEERENALMAVRNGGIAPLVWALWKLLKGEGDDIGPMALECCHPTLELAN